MSAPGEQPEDGRESKFSAYSNYHQVTGSVASAIDEAGDAYAYAAARKAEGKSLPSADAVRLRQYMKKAAMMLLPELRANSDADDVYDQDGATYLTLAPRILNLEKITDRLSELEDAVMTAVDDTSDSDGANMSVGDVLELLDVDQKRIPG